jgi:hypothetical protein
MGLERGGADGQVLEWSRSEFLRVLFTPGQTSGELRLEFSASDQRQELATWLSGLLAEGAPSELRQNLPEGWTLFWKLREGESRLLLARPTPETWVGTLALEGVVLQELIERTRAASQGDWQIRLRSVCTERGSWGRFSNLDVSLAEVLSPVPSLNED